MTAYIYNAPFCNVGSLSRALKKTFNSLDVEIITKVDNKINQSVIFLPGVSKFDAYIQNLNCTANELRLIEKSNKLVGICAGAQILFESSEEGKELGLALLPGRVKKINTNSVIKVPHLGWNKLIINKNHKMAHLFEGIDTENKKFYFSHSYRFPDSEHALAYVDYGERFPVMIAKDNLVAIQFHPEKSYNQGIKLLKNLCNFQ